jgi:hypothetical protein
VGLLELDTPYAGQGLDVPPETMFGALPTPAFDGRADVRLRTVAMTDPAKSYPLGRSNRELLLELSRVVGHEADDWQNPYAFASTGLLAYPSTHSPGIDPAYGVGQAQRQNEVAANITATRGVLAVGGFY